MQKITDKEAVDKARDILESCSPAARIAIQHLVTASIHPTPHPPRTMKREELKIISPTRKAPKIYDEKKERTTSVVEDEEWLSQYLK